MSTLGHLWILPQLEMPLGLFMSQMPLGLFMSPRAMRAPKLHVATSSLDSDIVSLTILLGEGLNLFLT